MKTRTSGHERAVGWGLVVGVALIVVGAIATWMCFAAGVHVAMATRDPVTDKVNNVGVGNYVPITLTVITLGVVIIIASMFYGAAFQMKSRTGPLRTVDHFKIMTRFGTDAYGNILAAEWQFESEDRVRYYVRGVYLDGSVDEFEVAEPVFWQCGEGMTGRAQVQGRWLGSFVPYIGTPNP